MAKYQIETTNGTFEIETDDGQTAPSSQNESFKDKAINRLKDEFTNPINYVPGLRPAIEGQRALGAIMEKSQEGYDLMGEKAAETIDQEGKHPFLSSAVGGTIQNIPNAVNAAMAIEAAPAMAKGIQAIPKLAKTAGQGLKARLQSVSEMLSSGSVQEAKDELNTLVNQLNLEKPAQSKAAELAKRGALETEERLAGLKQGLQEIPENFRQKGMALQELKSATKKEFGQVEEEMGIGFKSTPEFESYVSSKDKMAKFLDKASKLAQKGPERIAKETDVSTIQLYRKIAQEGRKNLSSMGRAQLEGYRETFAKSLEQVSDKFKSVRSRLAEVNQAIDDLPRGEKAAKEAARRQIIRAQSDLKRHNKEMAELMAEAKKADKLQLNDIKRRALVKVRQAAQKERLIKVLKYSVLAAGGLTYLKGKI